MVANTTRNQPAQIRPLLSLTLRLGDGFTKLRRTRVQWLFRSETMRVSYGGPEHEQNKTVLVGG
jgi:hypothetical protein